MGVRTGKPRGRPAGAKSKHTKAREKAVSEMADRLHDVLDDAFEGDAHALLMSVYKNQKEKLETRIEAAKAAIRYEKPALATVQHQGDEAKPLAFQAIERRVVDPRH